MKESQPSKLGDFNASFEMCERKDDGDLYNVKAKACVGLGDTSYKPWLETSTRWLDLMGALYSQQWETLKADQSTVEKHQPGLKEKGEAHLKLAAAAFKAMPNTLKYLSKFIEVESAVSQKRNADGEYFHVQYQLKAKEDWMTKNGYRDLYNFIVTINDLIGFDLSIDGPEGRLIRISFPKDSNTLTFDFAVRKGAILPTKSIPVAGAVPIEGEKGIRLDEVQRMNLDMTLTGQLDIMNIVSTISEYRLKYFYKAQTNKGSVSGRPHPSQNVNLEMNGDTIGDDMAAWAADNVASIFTSAVPRDYLGLLTRHTDMSFAYTNKRGFQTSQACAQVNTVLIDGVIIQIIMDHFQEKRTAGPEVLTQMVSFLRGLDKNIDIDFMNAKEVFERAN